MIDFSNNCVFCGSSDNLNTVMSMAVDDKEYKIAIDDACEDEALPKKIRKALILKIETFSKEESEKQQKLKQLMEAAAELGFELSPAGGSQLMIPTKQEIICPEPQQCQPPQGTANRLMVQKNSKNVKKEAKPAITEESAQSDTGFQSAEARPTPQPSITNKRVVRKKEWKIADRAGRPVKVPDGLIGENGKPDIKIVDSGGDKIIQRRMETLNAVRMQLEAQGVIPEEAPRDQFVECMSCDGLGTVKNVTCVRCKGHGVTGWI